MAENTITLKQAQTWRSNWKASGKAWMAENELQGWLVPGNDLSQVLGENGVNSRIYIGLTEEGTDGEPKVMIVAVDGDGKDMIDAANGLFIYDFSERIPPAGDPTSPLN